MSVLFSLFRGYDWLHKAFNYGSWAVSKSRWISYAKRVHLKSTGADRWWYFHAQSSENSSLCQVRKIVCRSKNYSLRHMVYMLYYKLLALVYVHGGRDYDADKHSLLLASKRIWEMIVQMYMSWHHVVSFPKMLITLAPVSICRAKGRVKVWIENNCTINLILSGLVWLDYGKISLSVKQVFWRLGLWRGTNYWSWRLGSAKDQPFQRAIGNLDGKTYKRWAGLCGQYVLHRRVQWAMDTN